MLPTIPFGTGPSAVGTCRIRDLNRNGSLTKSDNLKELKRAARNIARARRIKHVGALELVAQELGFPHWNALTKAEKGGWRPTENEIATSEKLVISENPFVSIAHEPWSAVGSDKFEGELLGHSYRVSTVTDDVRIWGEVGN